jgi:hypothetical protein
VYQGILIATDLIKDHEKEYLRQERRNKALENK